MDKNIKYVLLSLLLTVVSFGCTTSSSTKQIYDRELSIGSIKTKLEKSNDEVINQISTLSAGTEYSLQKVEEPDVNVKTAMDLNSRVLNLSGSPNLSDLEKIKETVDMLTSSLRNEQQRGQDMLDMKDAELVLLQSSIVNIKSQYDSEIEKLKSDARLIALRADRYQSTVDQVNSYMGLGGVLYGMKIFLTKGLLIIVVFLAIFIILKFAAQSNPIAASLFSIFEVIAGYMISAIKNIIPNAANCSNLVESKYKYVLTHYVSLFEQLKKSKSTTMYNLEDLFKLFSNELNFESKKLITDIRTSLKFKV
jgi:hypothetical protein